MLAPILPSPIMPSCIVSAPRFMRMKWFSDLRDCLLHGFRKRRESRLQILPQVHTQCAAAAFGKNREVAAGLCGFHDPEGVFLPGYRKILGIVASDLQKTAAMGTAFVGLSSGVQEARAKAETGGYFFLIPHGVPDRLQRLFIRGIHRDIAEDCEIVTRRQSREMRLQNVYKVRAAFQRRGIFFIGEKLDAFLFEERRFRRKTSGCFVLAPPVFGFVLVCLAVL